MSQIVFEKYDTDGTGSISKEEMRSLCYDKGYHLSEEKIDSAMATLDVDGTGEVTYDEFQKFWRTDGSSACSLTSLSKPS